MAEQKRKGTGDVLPRPERATQTGERPTANVGWTFPRFCEDCPKKDKQLAAKEQEILRLHGILRTSAFDLHEKTRLISQQKSVIDQLCDQKDIRCFVCDGIDYAPPAEDGHVWKDTDRHQVSAHVCCLRAKDKEIERLQNLMHTDENIISLKEQRIKELVAELETQVGDKVDAQIRGNRLEGLRQANWERADDLERENADLRKQLSESIPLSEVHDAQEYLKIIDGLRKELEIRESPNEFCDSPDCEWCKLRRENADLKAQLKHEQSKRAVGINQVLIDENKNLKAKIVKAYSEGKQHLVVCKLPDNKCPCCRMVKALKGGKRHSEFIQTSGELD